MAAIKIYAPRGKRPYVTSTHLLGTSDAVECANALFESGGIRGFDDDEAVAGETGHTSRQTLYQYDPTGDWFSFTNDLDFVTTRKTLSDEVIMYTGETEPRITHGAKIGVGPSILSYYPVGIPAPTAAPSVAATGTPDATPENDTRSYVYTYVNSTMGFESAPSPTSALVTVDTVAQTVNVTSATTSPTTGVDFKRIYRTATGTSGTNYQFVAEEALGTALYNDAVAGASLGEIIPTTDFDIPPSTLRGVVKHPAGFFVAFDGTKLCFSEPGYYYAWPLSYQLELEYPIVGIAAIGGAIAVMTQGIPYLVSGSNPASMVPRKMEEYLPCVSKRGIVDMGASAIYPSEESLVEISANGVRKITDQLYTKDQWKALNPSAIVGAKWRGLYLAMFPSYVVIMHPDKPEAGVTTLARLYTAHFVDEATGELFCITSTGTIVEFSGAATRTTSAWTWQSKPFTFPRPINMSAMRAVGEFGGTVTIQQADIKSATGDTYTYTTPPNALVANTPIRLASGLRYKSCEIIISGAASDSIEELHIATTMAELTSGS